MVASDPTALVGDRMIDGLSDVRTDGGRIPPGVLAEGDASFRGEEIRP
jgi:hypothetical protein